MTVAPKRFRILFSAGLAAFAPITSIGAVETTPAPAAAQQQPSPVEILISVPDQRLAVVRDGELVARFPISTSKFGVGDNWGSYRTPLGAMRVCDKIGSNLTPGAVIRHRSATGEVLQPNAPGRDPIVTRVIWLDGLEAQNRNARARGIYIHGTPEERTIGTPASYGCIRMRSKDVIRVFDEVPLGTTVSIIDSRLPHMHKWEAPEPQPLPQQQPEPQPKPESKPEPIRVAAAKNTPQPQAVKLPQQPLPRHATMRETAEILAPIGESRPAAAFSSSGAAASGHSLNSSILLANMPKAVKE